MRIHTTLTIAEALAAMALFSATASAQKVPTAQLIEMAKNHATGLEQALRDTLTDANIQKGAAAAGELVEFVFAVTADKQPNLVISAPRSGDAAPVAATRIATRNPARRKASSPARWCSKARFTPTPTRAISLKRFFPKSAST